MHEWPRGARNDSARANVSLPSNRAQEKRMRLVAISAAICLVALGPALGQSGNTGEKLDQGNTAQGANQNPQGANQNGQGANQNANGNPAAGDASAFHDQVKNELQQAGFSDVQV